MVLLSRCSSKLTRKETVVVATFRDLIVDLWVHSDVSRLKKRKKTTHTQISSGKDEKRTQKNLEGLIVSWPFREGGLRKRG